MRLELSSIHSISDTFWLFMLDCLEETFPINERRSPTSLAMLLSRSEINFQVILSNNQPIGVFNTWNLSLFRYIEHFAIVPYLRGNGFGQRLLHDYVHQSTTPVIIEVEPPVSFLAQRRIQFYENEGFVLCSNAYCQPAYDVGKKPVTLNLMEFGHQLLPERFDQVVDLLHQKVYQVHEGA